LLLLSKFYVPGPELDIVSLLVELESEHDLC